MRIFALVCVLALAACADTQARLAEAGLEDVTRVESFAQGANRSFTYSAQTNTVMTENDDGAAERIRRQWLAEALRARALCPQGYVVDSRRFVQQPVGPFANGGDIVYSGRCL